LSITLALGSGDLHLLDFYFEGTFTPLLKRDRELH